MLALAFELTPYVHRDGTPVAVGIASVILASAGLAAAVAVSRQSRSWRGLWLLSAGLLLLLALDEAVPLSQWLEGATGIRWWLLYALPVASGIIGWSGAIWQAGELQDGPPLQPLLLGTSAWIVAYGVRLLAYLNDHTMALKALSQIGLVGEAFFKLCGAVLLTLAFTQILRASSTALPCRR